MNLEEQQETEAVVEPIINTSSAEKGESATAQKEGDTVKVLGSPEASPGVEPAVPETLKEAPKKSTKKDPYSFKSMFAKTGKISVKPYVDKSQENMGLEKYDMAIFPGSHHEEQLAAIERNGVVRYITGLDEFAPEVQLIGDEETKTSVVTNIRNVVAYLEKMLATNVLEVESKDFWNNVKLLRPDNHEFWSKITLRCSNDALYLNPVEDPYDLIKFMAIEAGGFDLIGKSFEDAGAAAVSPKFFLDKESATISVRTTFKRLRNKAIGILDTVADKNLKKLLYITKVLDTNSATYKVHTPADVLYDALDEYINGNGIEPNPTKAAQHFIDTSKLDMETLKLKALVKDASFYKIISLKADGMLYHTQTSNMLGRNVSDVVVYLKNPLNEDVLVTLMEEIESFWNN